MVPFLAALCIGLTTSSAIAQDVVPNFRTNGYSPPVHIPPRIPVHDPGLPNTLNGRFNSTQQIRSSASNAQAGTRTNISDLNAQQAVRRDSRRSAPTAAPQQKSRRSGLQDRIAGLIAGNETRKAPVANQMQNTHGMLPRSTQQAASRRPARSSYSQSMRRKVAETVDSITGGRNLSAQQQQARRTGVDNRQAVQMQRPSPKQAERIPYYNRPDVRQQQQAQTIRTPQQPVRTASVQEYKRPKSEFVSRPQTLQNEFVGQSAHRNIAERTAQQFQLPKAISPSNNEKAVSVLNNLPNEEVQLTPPDSVFESGIELSDPESLNPGEIQDVFIEQPGASLEQQSMPRNQTNMLRSSVPIQDEQFGSDLNETDSTELESPFDDDDTERESNPLRKSCDEFRSQLLNSPITEIALDISPPGNTELFGENKYRTWRDTYGNELAQGSIVDLRRGYVIIDSNNGGQVRLPYARLSDADWSAISDYWKLPIECGLGAVEFVERCWAPQTATWHASALCHKPLYFENVQLERYGHSHGPFLQPAASTVHFFGKLFFLPYNTAINPPNECQYALGFYRPGNCAPWLKDPFPFSLAGASRQVFTYTGVGLLTN